MLNYDIHSNEKEINLLDTEYKGDIDLSNPFPGLRPFGLDEFHLFFGREGQVDNILLKLIENRFISILGYSGSGKSSLMYCGILPIIYGGFMTETGSRWNVITTRPGLSPIDNLSSSLVESSSDYNDLSEEDRLIRKAVCSSVLRGGSAGLVDLVKHYNAAEGDNLLIIVDQFEELFRYRDSSPEAVEEATAFVRILLEVVNQKEVPIYIVTSMRSDFMGDCALFYGLTELINKSNFLIPQLNRDQKRIAIAGPVAVGGGRITSRLLKMLLSEIGDDQDQLPILQHALMRTWDYWVENREPGEKLDVKHYNAVGRMSGALSQHANEAYDQLSDKDKRIAEILFKSLTEKGTDVYGLRRPNSIKNVASIAGVGTEEVISVVENFRKPGRSFLMPPDGIDLHADTIVEISHESLMRIWTKLKIWVNEEDESAQMYIHISEAAAMYQVGRAGLWRPPDLQLALNWQKKQNPTRLWAQRYDEAFERAIVFLDTSRITFEAEQRSQELMQKRVLRKARVVAMTLGIAAIILILMFVLAVTRQIEATQLADEAEIARNEALDARDDMEIAQGEAFANEEKAMEQAALADEQKLFAERETTKAIKAAELQRIARQEADRQTLIATNERVRADDQRVIAEGARKEANDQTAIAQEKTDQANRLLHLTVAQSMSVKSLQVQDADLKGLLAQQAYAFNKEFEGKEKDKYIYDGLYYALAGFEGSGFNFLGGHRGAVKSIAFEHGKNIFYSTGSDGRILKWDLEKSLKPFPVVVGNDNGTHPNRVLKISSDNKWLINASDSSYLEVYDLENITKNPTKVEGHTSFVYDIAFLPQNKGVVSVSHDGTMRIYDFKTSREIGKLAENLNSIDISRDGTKIIGGTNSGKLVEIELNNGGAWKVLFESPEANPIVSVRCSADDNWIAFGGTDSMLRLFNKKTGKVSYELTGHTSRIFDIDFSPDGKLMATASWDGSVQLWNMENLNDLPIVMSDHNEAYAWGVKFDNTGDYLIVGTGDDDIKIWPVHTEMMADELCKHIKRNMDATEWERYIGNGIGFRNTCYGLLISKN